MNNIFFSRVRAVNDTINTRANHFCYPKWPPPWSVPGTSCSCSLVQPDCEEIPNHLNFMTFRASLNHKQPSGVASFYLHVSEPTDSSVAAVLLMRYHTHLLTDILPWSWNIVQVLGQPRVTAEH